MKILHLEDNVEKHMNINSVLESIRETDVAWVTCVHAGMEKISEAENTGKPFDLVISDMHYPV